MSEKRADAPGLLPGVRVLVTRPPGRLKGLTQELEAQGARVLWCPLVDFEQVGFSLQPLLSGSYKWIVFSSQTTVDAVEAACRRQGVGALGAVLGSRFRVAALGPGTASRLREAGVRVDFTPVGDYSAAALAAQLPGAQGECVWLPQSARASPALARGLWERGAAVEVVAAYRTVPFPSARPLLPVDPNKPLLSLEQAREYVCSGGVDAVVVASGSAAEQLATALAPPARVPVVAWGPVTAARAEKCGLTVAATAARATVEGIIHALASIRGGPEGQYQRECQ